MSSLPIIDIFASLASALNQHPNVILVAPPGAGKSTQLPLMLLQESKANARILLLEPRRIAAKAVASRLAYGLSEEIGLTVGYRIRGEQKCSQHTQIEVITEGLLIRLIQTDPMLTDVELVIFDEFHERNLPADLALALLLDVQKSIRPDLKILIMSATLDLAQLKSRLPTAPLILAEGKSFPVTRYYQPLAKNSPFAAAVAAKAVAILQQQQGSLLVFLPGEAEIRQVSDYLKAQCEADIDIRPLYGNLPLAQQQLAIQNTDNRRKVVLATNIAETSLTIDGIHLVLDSALEKVAKFDAGSGQTLLTLRRISQSSMLQRAGRAGRLAPGYCWHLLSQAEAERLPQQSEPEIVRADLSGLLLELLHWGCQQPEMLAWLDPPPKHAQRHAQLKLQRLGAINAANELTSKGRVMAEFGSEPELAAILAQAKTMATADAAFTAGLIVAILEQPDRQRGIDFYPSFQTPSVIWLRQAQQWQQRLQQQGGQRQDHLLLPLLLSAFSSQLARRRSHDNRYQLANGQGARLPLDSPLQHYQWLLVLRSQLSAGEAEASIHLALPVDIEQIKQQHPALINLRRVVAWDDDALRLRVWHHYYLGKLPVNAVPGNQPEQGEAQRALLNWIEQMGLSVLNWTDRARQLQQRILCAADWLPAETWPRVDDAYLLQTLEQWLLPRMQAIVDGKSLGKLDIEQALRDSLDWRLRTMLDQALPQYYYSSSGQGFPIVYQKDSPPLLAIKMQQMFGQVQTPAIAKNTVRLQLVLLSPAGRPLQVTQDLPGFWAGAYKDVQKEMKGRYPKHAWPDNPTQRLPEGPSRKGATDRRK